MPGNSAPDRTLGQLTGTGDVFGTCMNQRCICVSALMDKRTCENDRMGEQPGPGRPRKWASNAERMRAYRASEREQRDALKGKHSTAELAELVVELTGERDRLWAQVVRLQQHVAELENQLAGHPPPAGPTVAAQRAPGGLSRAERRRLEREQARRRQQ
jgi:hypothetical protein